MTPELQKEHIITERDLRDLIAARYMVNTDADEAGDDEIHNLIAPVLKRVRASRSSTQSAEQVLDIATMCEALCEAIIDKMDSQSQLGFNALLIKGKIAELRERGREREP